MVSVFTSKDQVYEYITTLIRNGELMPGERINEAEICESLDISRTPVREALIQLAAEGVLTNLSRKGFVLKQMDDEDIEQLYEVMGVLDGLAAKKSVGKLTDKDISDMEFYIDTMDLAIKSSNFPMYHQQQEHFHLQYLRKCGSNVLIDCINTYKKKLLRPTYIDDPSGDIIGAFLESNNEHRQILRLMKEEKADELFAYLSTVHWRPMYAEYGIQNLESQEE